MLKNSFYNTVGLGALIAIGFSNTAFAQSAPSAETVQSEVVIVTATKRSERLVDVPISLSVIGGRDIQQTGIRELRETAAYIPNVIISQNNDYGSSVTIRGVGANSRNIGFDSRVGVYVDGIYMGQSPSLNQELLDVTQVEVLRGPQGTLFGKDTVAGAVNMITRKPGQDFAATIGASLGNLGYTEIKGMVNIPLSETVSFRAQAMKKERDGYIRNTITGNDLSSVDKFAYRAQLRWMPSDNFEANLSIDGLNASSLLFNGEPITDILGLFPRPLDRKVAFWRDPHESRDLIGSALTLEYKTPSGLTLKSLTGWRNTQAHFINTTDYSPTNLVSVDYSEEYDQLSQEFQVISADTKPLTWVAGVYLYRQNSDTNRDVIFGDRFNEDFIGYLCSLGAAGPAPSSCVLGAPDSVTGPWAAALGFGPEGSKVFNRGTVKTNSYAIFATANYNLSDRLQLGLGGRYSVVDKSVNWLLDGRNSGFFGIGTTRVAGNVAPLVNDRTDTSFTPTVSLTYKVNPTTSVYGRYATGFKSGGFNLDYINANELAANSGLEFDKETVATYEVGLKTLTPRLNISAAAFWSEFSDYQVNQFIVLDPNRNPPLTSIRITNAASVVTKGVEIEASYKVTPNFRIQGSLGLLDAVFDNFPGGATGGTSASGKTLPNAPELSLTLGGQYYHQLPSLGGKMVLRADLTHVSEIFLSVDNTRTATYGAAAGTPAFGVADASTSYNASLGFLPDNDRYSVFIWGRNLTDERDVYLDFQDFFGTKVRFPGIGRTYGADLVFKF
jgi:iron complex outermembrane receptor protein